jgi:hypothetical protein
MRYINIRTFVKHFFKEVKDLPVTVTRFGIPIFLISAVEDKPMKVFSTEKPVEEPKIPEWVEATVAPKEFHMCDSGGCEREGVIKKGEKWFCYKHI